MNDDLKARRAAIRAQHALGQGPNIDTLSDAQIAGLTGTMALLAQARTDQLAAR